MMTRRARFAPVLALLLWAILAPGVAHALAWYDDDWLYRRSVTIANPGGSALSGFQVLITLPGTFDFGKARSDGGDVRVTAGDGTTPLPCWIERWNPAAHEATLWVRVPAIPPAGATVYLYYGNPAATAVSDGEGTFEFFDDFEGTVALGYYPLGPAQTIMEQNQSWETEAPHTLSVVPAPSGAAYPYYGYYGLEDCGGIGMAGSSDLVHWTKFKSNPLFSGHGERWAHVVLAGGTYYMVHTMDWCGTSYIVYRTSTNGTSWGNATTMVARVSGWRNQNPNIFRDPNDNRFYLYWYQGDESTVWRIKARTATTVAGLASAPDIELLASPTVFAAPNMLYRDGTYFLATEYLEGEWKVRIYEGPSALGPFTELPNNPVMDGGCACLFQTPIGQTLYEYYCKKTNGVWTLDMRLGDLSAGRQVVGALDADKWDETGGDWGPVQATQQYGTPGLVAQGVTFGNEMLKSAYSGGDYVVEGYGRQLAGSTWGLGARAADEANGYTLDLYEDLDGTNNLYLYRSVNGSATELWKTGVGPIAPNQWYRLKLKVAGQQFRVYFNDVLVTAAPVTDARYSSGSMALHGEAGTTAQFNDVRVRKYAAVEPTTSVGQETSPGNTSPDAEITSPAAGSFYVGGQTIDLTCAASDAQDPPEALAYRWDVERHYADDPPVTQTFLTSSAAFVAEVIGEGTLELYRIKLRVTDSDGLSDSAAVEIHPEVDLAPSAVTVTPAAPTADDSLTLAFSLRNSGRAPAPVSGWLIVAGGTILAEGGASVAALDSVGLSVRCQPLPAGTHTLRLVVDTLAAVTEMNETNNASVRALVVAPYGGPNRPPVASASGAPTTGLSPLTVSLSSAGSADPDNDPLTFSWTFGDGDSSTAANPSHTYRGAGTYTATLRVRDGRGGIGTATVSTAVYGASGGFPATGVLDDFNRPNGPVGGAWVDETAGLTITGGLLALTGAGATTVWSGAVFGPTQEAYITLAAVSPTAPEQNLMLKVQGLSWSTGHIEVRYDATQHWISVGTYAPAQGWVQRGATIPVTFAAGDRFGARAHGNGTLEVFRNATLLGTVSVAGWPYAAQGGRLGLTLTGAAASRYDNFGGGTVSVTGVEPPTAAAGRLWLSCPYPNPSRGVATSVQLGLPRVARVALVVHDVSGRQVRRLLSGVESAGTRVVTWDGRSESGDRVPAGVYLIRLEAEGFSATRRVLVIP